ncbi:hypothetical protein D3C81_2024790 [compost metagenome]
MNVPDEGLVAHDVQVTAHGGAAQHLLQAGLEVAVLLVQHQGLLQVADNGRAGRRRLHDHDMAGGGFTRLGLAIARQAVKSIRGGAVSIRHVGFPVDPPLLAGRGRWRCTGRVVSC